MRYYHRTYPHSDSQRRTTIIFLSRHLLIFNPIIPGKTKVEKNLKYTLLVSLIFNQ